jgi:hypothetical protein
MKTIISILLVSLTLGGVGCERLGDSSKETVIQPQSDNNQADFPPFGLDRKTYDAIAPTIPNENDRRASCLAFIKKFGEIKSFRRILRETEKNYDLLMPLFEKYKVPVGANKYHRKEVPVPKTLAEACKMGVENEKSTIEMYDKFLEFVKEDDIRRVFMQIRDKSKNAFLSVFERCN